MCCRGCYFPCRGVELMYEKTFDSSCRGRSSRPKNGAEIFFGSVADVSPSRNRMQMPVHLQNHTKTMHR